MRGEDFNVAQLLGLPESQAQQAMKAAVPLVSRYVNTALQQNCRVTPVAKADI
ncbi:hypothetical protein [Advenella sp. S44]|uniref:hypothetical protein n=1 Tax=Advenella sp. S44 TaxID=1982755 RepID=UPI0013747746|nr:hypothetical protein [Advenella sp. S44]